jgi:SAM-dependent methyltransferase
MDYKNKWNDYTIGDIPFSKNTKDHFCREMFCCWSLTKVLNQPSETMTVLEIGPGECFEAKKLLSHIDYAVVDISDVFLQNAKKLGLKTIESDMINIHEKVKEKYDVVYMNSVLEHSPDLEKTIKSIKKVANIYFITMFRWGYNGNVKSNFHDGKKKYYTSTFDIDKIFKMLGNVKNKIIVTKDDKMICYDKYDEIINKPSLHRNGDRLIIIGDCK